MLERYELHGNLIPEKALLREHLALELSVLHISPQDIFEQFSTYFYLVTVFSLDDQ